MKPYGRFLVFDGELVDDLKGLVVDFVESFRRVELVFQDAAGLDQGDRFGEFEGLYDP
jgi:hypothetical protein